jgi:hypothetical protein
MGDGPASAELMESGPGAVSVADLCSQDVDGAPLPGPGSPGITWPALRLGPFNEQMAGMASQGLSRSLAKLDPLLATPLWRIASAMTRATALESRFGRALQRRSRNIRHRVPGRTSALLAGAGCC